jgi:hypothetical protein
VCIWLLLGYYYYYITESGPCLIALQGAKQGSLQDYTPRLSCMYSGEHVSTLNLDSAGCPAQLSYPKGLSTSEAGPNDACRL